MFSIIAISCESNSKFRYGAEEIVGEHENNGWHFYELVGEIHGEPEPKGKTVKFTKPNDSITAVGNNSGANGYGKRNEIWRKEFSNDSFEYKAVIIMTSPADNYTLVFKRRLK